MTALKLCEIAFESVPVNVLVFAVIFLAMALVVVADIAAIVATIVTMSALIPARVADIPVVVAVNSLVLVFAVLPIKPLVLAVSVRRNVPSAEMDPAYPADAAAMLCDALLEAGCAVLAEHFRGDERHPKGCAWLDAVLGME